MSVNSKTDKNKHRLNIFSTYFANVIQLLKEKSMPLRNFAWKQPLRIATRTQKIFQIKHISTGFVLNELKKIIQKGKSTGVDGRPAGMLKDIREFISKPCIIIIASAWTSRAIARETISREGERKESGHYSRILKQCFTD